jgi:hypothetical protein
MINDLKERVLEQANVTNARLKLERRHHRNMIFEAALIAVLARHSSNDALRSESPDFFRAQYSQHYDLNQATELEFQMFFRYYWTMRVAAPLFFISKNQGHSLRLLPRLVEAKNVDYQYGGESSQGVKFRIKIFTVELDRWRYYTHGFDISQLSSAPTRQDVPLGAMMSTPMPAATPTSAPTTSSNKRIVGEKRSWTEEAPISYRHSTPILPTSSTIILPPPSTHEFRQIHSHPSSTLRSNESHIKDRASDYVLDWKEIIMSIATDESLEAYLSTGGPSNSTNNTHLPRYPTNRICSTILAANQLIRSIGLRIFGESFNANFVWIVPIGYCYREVDGALGISKLRFELRCLDTPSDHMHAMFPTHVQILNQLIDQMFEVEETFRELHACFLGFAQACVRQINQFTTSQANAILSSLINSIRNEAYQGSYFDWEVQVEHHPADEEFYDNDDNNGGGDDENDGDDLDGELLDAAMMLDESTSPTPPNMADRFSDVMDIDEDQDNLDDFDLLIQLARSGCSHNGNTSDQGRR